MKKIILIVAILFVITAAALGGISIYNSYYNSIGSVSYAPPNITIGEESLPLSGSVWTYPVLFQPQGKTIAEDYDVTGLLLENTEQPPDIIAPGGYTVKGYIYSNGEALFSGTLDELNDYELAQPGLYNYMVTIEQQVQQDGSFGTFSYGFDYNLVEPVIPPSITVSTTEVPQGESISVYLHNLPEGVEPQIDSELGSTLFVEREGVYTAIIPTGYLVEPGKYSATVTVGDYIKDIPITVVAHNYGTQSFTMDTSTSALADSATASAEYREIIYPLYDTKDDNIYWEGTFLMPAEGRISSEYGLARYINGSFDGYHGGIDIAAPEGTPIIAPNHAKVEYAGFLQLSGNTIVLDYGGGLKAYLFHMSALHVQTGDMVEKGQLIAYMGTTGYSTGSHLHYQLQINRYAMNPWGTFDGTSGIFEDVATTELLE